MHVQFCDVTYIVSTFVSYYVTNNAYVSKILKIGLAENCPICACFFFQLASYDILSNMTGRNISDYLMKTNYEFYKRRFGGKVSLHGVESFCYFLHGFSLSIKMDQFYITLD